MDVRPGPFFSLKWKAILLSSVLLGGLSVWFTVRGYTDQLNQFRRERHLIRAKYAGEAHGVLQQSLQRLRQIGGLVPSLSGVGDTLRSERPEEVRAAFDHHWPELRINMALEVARIYDPGARLLGAWGQGGLEGAFPAPVPTWVLDANSRERPRSGLDCDVDCMQYVAVPLFEGGRHRGVVVLGTSFADVVHGFKSVSGADVGLLLETGGAQREGMLSEGISPWGVRVVALSEPSRNMEVLRSAALQYPSLKALEEGVQVERGDRVYEVGLISIEGFDREDRTRLVVISDVSEPLAQIRKAARRRVYVGLLGLVLGEVLLFALLGPPMSRLRKTVNNLPLLAESGFESVREAIGTERRRVGFSDEIDILDRTTVRLSLQLESLEQIVHERNLALENQMEALARERDFVTSLLDTAQVIILTQDANGHVTMVNPFGRTLLGDLHRGASPLSFDDLLAEEEDFPDLRARLEEIGSRQRAELRHEARLRCQDGSERHIAWLHSRVAGRAGDGGPILSIGVDVTARKRAESRLAWLADHDPLTGLYNRRRFGSEVEQAVAVAQRYERNGAILLIDLDQFRYINDTSGHQAGDILLSVVTHSLSRVVRSVDTVARLGGDEFGILVRETDERGAVGLAKKIVQEVGEIEFPIEGSRHRIDASIGIVLFPASSSDVEGLLAAAEVAMYQAKEQGRGRWHVYSPQTETRQLLQTNVYWKNRVEKALSEDRFVLHYQPILDLHTGCVTHYEALLRMLDHDGGLIPPGTFISVCEEAGLIHRIDNLVLEKAVAQLSVLDVARISCRISLNLSAHSFRNTDFVESLKRTLAAHGVPANRLIFEITETAAVADFAAARTMMEELRVMGCSIAMDDFGVGFSSLCYLKELPVDYVKIDGSFIRRICDSHDDQILVRAMSDIARGFGKKIVAEFVENESILEALSEYQVDYAQGYHIGKPMPPEEIFGTVLEGPPEEASRDRRAS